ncbi:2-oxo acid dehydrogenase subunit E2 [Agromyces tropicus]|uniref:2-oxo acid dehydrogenase subunit E2 n=1 Tax=Agromyces tropicus TaxID=555371 RepID=UPI0031D385DD
MPDLRMPSLGADMERGKVVEWLVRPGDYVHRGDLIAEVDTEKTVMEIESFEEGVLAEYLVELGQTVPVGTPIARVTGTPADVPAGPPATPIATPPDVASPDGAAATAAAERAVPPPIRHLAHRLDVDVDHIDGTGPAGAVTRADVEAAASAGPRSSAPPEPAAARPPRSSPRARRLADELGVDLARLTGTGPDGAVIGDDVRRAAEGRLEERPAGAVPAPTAGGDGADVRGERARAAERTASLRRAIGSLMARSKREIPHYYLSTTIDLSSALEWMRDENADLPLAERLVPAALLLAASARAAKQVPEMNGLFVDGAFRPSDAVHLGVAVALRGGGLVAPAIHDAERLAPGELMSALRDVVARARAGRLRRTEMSDPTITVTNLGDLGVESVFGVIYAPQVALVGFGRVVERPWAIEGLLGVRPVVTATLSADHRVSDGLRGGRFLALVDELLQKPEEL